MPSSKAARRESPEAYSTGYVEGLERLKTKAWEMARLGAPGLDG